MSKSLALGYALCIATLLAMIALGRGALPQLDGFTTFFYASLAGLLMFLAAFLCFKGARSSAGRIRKLLAYCVSALSIFIATGSAVAVVLVLIGSAKPG